MAQILKLFLEEVTLDFLQMEISLSKPFKHLVQVTQVGIYIFGIDQDIIQIHESKVQSLKDSKDQGLEVGWGLGQAERTFVELEFAQGRRERGLLLCFGCETHVMITHGDIQRTEDSGTSELA